MDYFVFKIELVNDTSDSKMGDFSFNLKQSKPSKEILFALKNSNPIDVSNLNEIIIYQNPLWRVLDFIFLNSKPVIQGLAFSTPDSN